MINVLFEKLNGLLYQFKNHFDAVDYNMQLWTLNNAQRDIWLYQSHLMRAYIQSQLWERLQANADEATIFIIADYAMKWRKYLIHTGGIL